MKTINRLRLVLFQKGFDILQFVFMNLVGKIMIFLKLFHCALSCENAAETSERSKILPVKI